MVDKLTNENVKKKDLELILEVNKKTIEIQSEVSEQNEDIIQGLSDIKKKQDDIEEKLDKLVDNSDEISKDLFKIQILFITGMISVVIQVIQMFMSMKK